MIESATHNNSDVGRRIAQIRVVLNLSQAELAEKIGGTKSGIQGNEAGIALPNSKLLMGLHDLGVNVNWILSGEGEMLRATSNASCETPLKSFSLDELLESSIRLVNMTLAGNQITLEPEKLSTLTMLIYDAQRDGKKGDSLKLFMERLAMLVTSKSGPSPVSEPLSAEEQMLIATFRSSNSTKKSLMLGHVPKLQRAA